MPRRKTNIYDPRYRERYGNIGESIRQNNLENLVEQRRYYPAPIPEDEDIYNIDTSGSQHMYDPAEYSNTPGEESNEPGFFDRIGNWFVDQGHGIIDRLSHFDDLIYMARERQLQGARDTAAGKARESAVDLNTLQGLSDFIDLHEQYKQLQASVEQASAKNDPVAVQQAQYQVELFLQSHPDYYRQANEYFSQIRTNPTLQKLFYNTSTGNIGEDLSIVGRAAGENFASQWDSGDEFIKKAGTAANKYGGLGALWEGLKAIGKGVINGPLQYITRHAVDPVMMYVNSLRGLTGQLPEANLARDQYIRQYIASENADEQDLQSLRKYNLDNLGNAGKIALKNEINELIADKQRDYKQYAKEYSEYVNKLNNGAFLYNEDWIDPKLRQQVENREELNKWIPWEAMDYFMLNIPEVGTSFSDLKSYLGSIVTAVGAEKLGQLAASAISPGKYATAAKLAIGALGYGAGLGFTMSGRESETAQEALNAQIDRITNSLEPNGINFEQLKPEIIQNARQHGLDLSRADNQDLLGAVLALNIKTTDPVFNELVKQAHKGVSTLVAKNNALTYMDMLQAVPFLNPTKAFSMVGDATRKMTNKLSSSATAEAIEEAAENSIKKKSIMESAQSWIDKRIDKVATAAGMDLAQKVAARESAKSIARGAGRLGLVAAGEGIEEGQQRYISYGYQTGAYDSNIENDFNSNTFDLKSLVDDSRLAYNAILSYYGLNFGDPLNGDRELRESMNSGTATGLFFGLGGNLVSSIYNKEVPLRQLVRNYQNDKFLIRTIAENYGRQNSELQASVLFDAFKNGMTGDRAKMLFDDVLKIADPDYASKEDIDNAKTVADIAYGAYVSSMDAKNNVLEKLKITPKSEGHREYVKMAASSYMDFAEAQDKQKISSKSIEDYINNLIQNLSNDEWLKDRPQFKAVIERLRGQYNDEIATGRNDLERKKFTLKNKIKELSNKASQLALSPENENPEQRVKEIEDTQSQIEKLTSELNGMPEEFQAKNSFEQVRDNFFRIFYLQAQQNVLQNLRNQMVNQVSRMKHLNEAYGTTLNTDHLSGMYPIVDRIAKSVKQRYDTILDDLMKDVSKEHRSEYKQYLEQEYASLNPWMSTDRQTGNTYVSNDEIKNSFIIEALNSGLAEVMESRAAAYVYNSGDPRRLKINLHKLNYQSLTDEQKANFQQEILRKYREEGRSTENINFKLEWDRQVRETKRKIDNLIKEENRLRKNQKTDKGLIPSEFLKRISEIHKEAALLFLQQEYQDRQMKLAAMRQDEEVERPVTNDDLDAAEDGDVQAQQKVEQEAAREEEQEHVDAGIPTETQETPKEVKVAQKQLDEARRKAGMLPSEEDKKDIDKEADEIEQALGKTKRVPDEQAGPVTPESINALFQDNPNEGIEEATGFVPAGTEPIPEISPEEETQGVALEQSDENEALPESGDTTLDHTNRIADPEKTAVEKDPTALQGPSREDTNRSQQSDPQSAVNNDRSRETGAEKQVNNSQEDNEDGPDDSVDNPEEQEVSSGEEQEVTEETSEININLGVDKDAQIAESKGEVYGTPVSDLDVTEDGVAVQNGIELNPDQAGQLNSEQQELSVHERDKQSQALGETPTMTVGANADFEIPLSFNYTPDSTTPMVFKANGKELFKNKTMATGAQLGQKLLAKGWIDRVVQKFYIVTNSEGNNASDFTVAMIMVDPDDSNILYNVTLKTPSEHAVTVNKITGMRMTRLQDIITNLEFKNVSREVFAMKYNRMLQRFVDEYNDNHNTQYTIRSISGGENYAKFKDQILTIRERARMASAIDPGSKIYTDAEIKDYLRRLNEVRQEIIDAYCIKRDGKYIIPDKVRTDVTPITVTQTAGRFNTQTDESQDSIFRTIVGEEGGFGLGNDTKEISDQIRRGEVKFGVGTGALSSKPFAILQVGALNQSELIPGRGLAGKIYVVIPSSMIPGSTQESRPMMLSEKKMYDEDYEVIDEEIYQEAIDSAGSIKPDNNTISTAELAFRLMCTVYGNSGGISLDQIILNKQSTGRLVSQNRTLTIPEARELLNLILNNGDHTLLAQGRNARSKQQKLALTFPYYYDKQIAIKEVNGQLRFMIGDEQVDERGNIRKFLHLYTMDELFPPQGSSKAVQNDAEANRKHIIHLISKNMHWNTELTDDDGRNAMDKPFSNIIQQMLKDFFFDSNGKRIKDRNVFNPFGNEDLSFAYEDFFTEAGEWKNPMVFAWMLKTGKLLTNTGTVENKGKDLFTAPFVYAAGVNAPKPEQKAVEQEVERVAKDTKTTTKEQGYPDSTKKEPHNYTKVNNLVIDTGSLEITRTLTSPATEQRTIGNQTESITLVNRLATPEEVTEINEGRIKAHGKDAVLLTDRLWIRIPRLNDPSKSSSEIDAAYKKLLDDKLEEIKKQYRINGKPLKKITDTCGNYKSADLFLMDVYSDGTATVYKKPYNYAVRKSKRVKAPMWPTGVFSTFRGEGKIDVTKAKSWLQSALGLEPDQIIVVNGLVRAVSDKDVYASTKWAVNTVTNEIYPYIVLSRQSGEGNEYHEGWHMVNLVLHNSAMRDKMYEEWARIHPESKGRTKKQIEEEMAEDFKAYMLGYDDNAKSPRIIRFFKNIITFIRTYRTKGKILSRVYNDIRKGRYKGEKLDQDTLREFKENYPYGANFDVPGVPKSKLQKFKTISDYHDYYECANQIMNIILSNIDLSTVERIQNITSADFKKAFDVIRMHTKSDDPYVADIAQDVLDNIDAFEKTINTIFKSYKIKAVKGKKKLDQDNKQGKDSGDVADNIWDIDHLEVSQKTNVSFKAKMFFSTVPKMNAYFDEQGNRIFEEATDGIFEAPEFVPFSEVWNKIKNDLWDCDSFDNIDPATRDFDKNSIVYRVRRLKKVDGFYEALDRKITPLIDQNNDTISSKDKIEIKTHIFNTIIGFKNHILTMAIKPPIQKASRETEGNVEGGEVATNTVQDINKSWEILDASNFHSMYSLPKQWSKNFATSSGAIETVGGKTRINSNYAKKLNKYRNQLKQSTNPKRKDRDLENVKLQAVRLLNYLGIPFDDAALQIYIDEQVAKSKDIDEHTISDDIEFSVVRDLITNTKAKGSIGKFINQIINMQQQGTTTQHGKNKDKEIDEIFTGFAKTNKGNTQIINLALAYSRAHPSASEFSVTGANGVQLYPFNQNNFMSDRIRALKHDTGGIIGKMMRTAQCENSLLLKTASLYKTSSQTEDNALKLHSFVCLRDDLSGNSADYFGITPLEDYLAKLAMTHNKMFTMPTMADKKTWYAISSNILSEMLTDDVLAPYARRTKEDGSAESYFDNTVRFSDNTLNIFAGYLYDELNCLAEYYNADNIKFLQNHRNKLLINFHGNVRKYDKYDIDYYDFSGNGGKFRYFYQAQPEFIKYLEEQMGQPAGSFPTNMNQLLELLFNVEHENNESQINKAKTKEEALNSISDGFEMIRTVLQLYAKWLTDNNSQNTRTSMNSVLLENVRAEIQMLGTDDNIKLFTIINNQTGEMQNNISKNGKLVGGRVPNSMVSHYRTLLKSNSNIEASRKINDANAIFSLIANHVARTMMSVIETEKVFTGDSAFYIWKYYKNSELETPPVYKFTLNGVTREVPVSVLKEKNVDKIKRLGSVLSPGTNLKTSWVNSDYAGNEDILKDFHTSKYTFANIADISADSVFLEPLKEAFTKQEVADAYRRVHGDAADAKTLQDIYNKEGYYQEILKGLPEQEQKQIQQRVKTSMSPYSGIKVSDAQVILRPAMYRKLRIAVGEWSFEPDATGYSDEIAYNMIENTSDWMNDPQKYAIAKRLMLKPLKMSYFQNDISTTNSANQNLVVPIYNKMAMFPMFKFLCTSTTGKQLYDRMNMPGNEIDMFGFESAVKVGCNQQMYSPFDEHTKSMDTFKDGLNLPSDQSINYSTGEINTSGESQTLAVQVQDMDNLHLQLNTDAHEATERGIGTQMMKVCFSNIVDDFTYGKNNRLGRDIRADIMNIINAKTSKGRDKIFKRFFKKDRSGKYNIPNRNAIRRYLLQICQNNNLGNLNEEVLENNGVIASLTSRLLFENSISSMINKEIVDINTSGGAAVQQSVFGFVSSNESVISEKVFKHRGLFATPLENFAFYPETLKKLNDANIKTVGDILRAGENRIKSILKSKKYFSDITSLFEDFDLSFGMDIDKIEQIQSSDYQLLNEGKELQWYKENGTMEVYLSMNFFRHVIPQKYQTDYTTMRKWLLDNNIIGANSEPFGVGYRIPTQGMSSTFGFVVADVLPEISGDLIVVPREFTAQTGSDFDVDKIYLATYSYDRTDETSVRSKVEDSAHNYTEEEYMQMTDTQLNNKLIDNYMDILTDYKNISNTRASIDVLTSILKKDIVPFISVQDHSYPQAGSELLPSFQAMRKMEYSTGKSGIATFALNVTNHAITQAVHLNIRHSYLGKLFGFKQIDDIVGIDGYRIADWLSAMVNAHVDVAKDPYILSLNVNSATYNHVNYLLRSGVGKGTFTFIAQPILKEFASQVVANKGMYGVVKDNNKFAGNNALLKELQLKWAKKFIVQARIVYKNTKDQSLKDQISYYANQVNLLITPKYEKGKRILPDWETLFANEDLNIFSPSKGVDMLTEKTLPNSNEPDIAHSMFRALYQVGIAQAYLDLKNCADKLAKLVTVSRIDTKKFGNNIPSQLNFVNNYLTFKYDDDINNLFYIRNQKAEDGDFSLPMRTYFDHTFLDKKLRYATSVTKMILANESFTATKLFSTIFNSVMANMYGATAYSLQKVLPDGQLFTSVKYGYKTVMNDDTVKAIGNAIDTIMRHRAMVYQMNKDSDSNDGVSTNFSISDDIDIVRTKINQLIYGDKDVPSIPKRIAKIKTDIRKEFIRQYESGEVADWLWQLCNDDGSIRNDFLNYLTPIIPNKGSDKIDRIILSDSSMDVDGNFKNQLYSAFEELLELSTNSQEDREIVEDIRNLAKDLILYAYYTTYNNSSVNQFFDLIPAKYRKGYDQALSTILKDFWLNDDVDYIGSILGDVSGDLYEPGTNNQMLQVYDMSKLIARNFWWDSNIVGRYTNASNRKANKTALQYPSSEQIIHKAKVGNRLIATTFATPNTDASFITIEYGKEIYLYQKIGEQVLMPANPDRPSQRYKTVYQLIPKLGIRNNKNKIYEFYGKADDNSSFSQNNLPESATLNMREVIKESTLTPTEFEKLSKSSKALKYYSKFAGIRFEPISNIPTTIYDPMAEMEADDGTIQSDPIVLVNNAEESRSKCLDDSNYVINFGNNQVSVSQGTSISTFEEIDPARIIDNIINSNMYDETLSVYLTGGNLDKIQVNKSEFDKYISDRLNAYRQYVQNGAEDPLTKQQIDDLVSEKRDELLNPDNISQTELEFKQSKLKDVIRNLIDSFESAGIDLGGVVLDNVEDVANPIQDLCEEIGVGYTKYTISKNPVTKTSPNAGSISSIDSERAGLDVSDGNAVLGFIDNVENTIGDILTNKAKETEQMVNEALQEAETPTEEDATGFLNQFKLTKENTEEGENIKKYCGGK